jgi:uncharacterized membrane protein
MSWTLRTGALAAMALILVGLLWAGASGYQPGASPVLPLGQLLDPATLFAPLGLLNLGMVVLLLTPVAGILVAGVSFVAQRDWRYAAVSLAVLLILVLGAVLSL